MKNTLTLLLFCLLGILFPHAQTKVYVSYLGNDNNPGTLAKPFKTPERALQEIEKAKGKSLIIYLRKGIYYLQKPIVLDNKNLKTKSLLISSYPGEQAFISAGQLLKTDWKPYKNGIYVTTIPQDINFERLYADEKLQVLAVILTMMPMPRYSTEPQQML
ncbi:hypothetical protein ACH34E_09210 [Elizabethkingia anophelis]